MQAAIEGFQLSPQQKRVWFLQECDHEQPYRVQGMVLIEGEIDSAILEIACQKVVEKYEILRTNFPVLKGMTIPLQVVRDRAVVTIDDRALVGLNVEAEIEEVFQSLNQLLFDFERGSVLSISLVKFDSKKRFLFIAMPAICADTASLHNLVREIGVAYTNCLQGKEFSDTPLQYADIAAWQNELFEGEDTETPKEYWCKQDFSKFLTGKLPYEQQPVEKPIFNPKVISINLNPNLELLAGQDPTKIRALLMTCWQILLWRLTGHSEMAIAFYCDGRNYEELAPTIGLFAKYLPVYVKLNADAQLTEIWQQVSQAIEEVEQWQESFNWEEISQDREKGQQLSFFPFAFDFVTQPHPYVAGNITLSLQKQYTCIDQFKLKLVCLYQNNTLAALHYDANLYNQEDIERLAAQFQTLLASAVNNPEIAPAQLDILSPRERQQLLVEFNHTQTDSPPYQSIHQWFEAQVQQTPENIAVVCENQSLTYRELDTKANQVAHHLVSLGVAPEVIVALCVERSLDLIIGILGILKAGGAYLPLDPTLPAEALAFRLQDSQASILLTQQHLINQVPQHQAPVVCIDIDIPLSPTYSLPLSSPHNLVYVIYTSGSTGKPKGVAVEHRQLLNYINGIFKQINVPEGSSFATVSTFAADLGNTAIFAALCTGGCLHIISQERATNPEALADYCCRHSIDCLKIVPSHLTALLTYPHPEQILPKKCLILGGEAASWELISQVQTHAPDCQIFNHYGPTETTVGVLTYPVTSHLDSDKVPLGRPLTNTQIYLLDSYQQPVPIGVPGEIYIGGDSVARGYLNRPELTAEKFIPNPFSNFGLPILDFRLGDSSHNPCIRSPLPPLDKGGVQNLKSDLLYKTGDLARFLPDGILEFLGRIDAQIKLHGFRIELGEIEITIRQHSDVREAVVLLREDEPGVQRLVAYVVPHRSQNENFISKEEDREKGVSVENLRDFVRQKVPEYMVPSNFVLLKVLPLTSNGKVDRKSLPIPERLQPELTGDFVPPQNEVERAIASIWQDLLHIEKVGIHDNFFDIGGHSLLLIQLHSKLREAFNKTIAVSDIFKHPTINALAKYISQQEDTQISSVTQSYDRADLRRELIQKQRKSKPRGLNSK